MFSNDIYKKIIKKIKEYDEIVIARHIGPDPDAIASEISLRDTIKLNFKNKKVYAIGAPVSKFKYLGSLDKIDETKLSNPLLIILDIPEFPRADSANKDNYKYTIKIDHHPCDHQECDLELVDESATSTCEILTKLIYKTNLKINKEIAEKLYVGIVSDSDRFLLLSTSSKTFELVSKLFNNYDIDLDYVYNNLYDRPISERRFESYLIDNINITDNGFGYLKITNYDYKKYKVDSNTASNMINDLNHINELKCWAFSSYDENQHIYRINIRSRKIVINDVAEKYHGGGHAFASGARIQSEDEVDELFKALDERCKEYNENNK